MTQYCLGQFFLNYLIKSRSEMKYSAIKRQNALVGCSAVRVQHSYFIPNTCLELEISLLFCYACMYGLNMPNLVALLYFLPFDVF